MIIRKSRLGLALFHREGKTFVAGYPRALECQRFWESAEEFQSYLQEQGLGTKIKMLSEPTAFYAVADQDTLEKFLNEAEAHFSEDV